MDNVLWWYIVGILHIIGIITISIYTLLIRKSSKLDLYFLLLFALVNMHWILYEGECFISYYYKDTNNDSINEMSTILGNELYTVLIGLFVIMYAINTYIVGKRQGINQILIVSAIVMFTICITLFRFENINYYYYGVPNFLINFAIFLSVINKLLYN